METLKKNNDELLKFNYEGTNYEFYSCPEHGCFYQVGFTGKVGELYIPMNADSTPDLHNGPCTIEVTWENA
jgi:hypothetical protein